MVEQSYLDKVSNIILKDSLKIPSTSTVITNPDLETSLVYYNDVNLSENMYIETIPSLSQLSFDKYYLYTTNTVIGYYVSNNLPTSESFNVIKGLSDPNSLNNSFSYFSVEIWQEFINGTIDKIYISTTSNSHIIKIENLKTNIISDTYNPSYTPSYYNPILKDILLETLQGKGYTTSLYGLSGISNIKIDISNKDIGEWFIKPETGIINFLDNNALVVTGGIQYNLFSTGTSTTDNALFNRVKSPYVTFYKYVGKKGLTTYATIAEMNLVPMGSNISFLDYNRNVNSTIVGTSDGGITFALNPTSSNMMTISGNVKADRVTSTRFVLSPNAASTIQGAFLSDGTDLFFVTGNVGIGTATPSHTLDIWGSVFLHGPTKIGIQANVDGGSAQGIFMKDVDNSSWGIYLSTAGAFKSLNSGTTVSGYNSMLNDSIRFRANSNIYEGFIWENSSEQLLMSLNGGTGELYVKNKTVLETLLLNGSQYNGGAWLSIGSGNYGSFYQDATTGRYGLVSTSKLNTASNLQWGVQINRDGATSLSYGGSEKLLTTSVGTTLKDFAKIGDHDNLTTANTNTALTVHKYNALNDSTYIQFYSDGLTTFNSTDGMLFGLNTSNVELTNYENSYIKFKNNGVDAFYISPTGLVGINTTNPKSNLDISGNIVGTSYYSSNSYINGGFWVPVDSSGSKLASFVSSSNDNEFGILTSEKLNSYSNQKWFLTGDTVDGKLKLYYNSSNKLETLSDGIQINSNLYTTILSASKVGIGMTNPSISLYINSNDAIKIPSGTTLQRPSGVVNGTIRYNTDLNSFEGFINNAWSSLGGVVSDLDQNTYIIAENTVGANNNQLKFVTATTSAMIIDSNQYVGIGTTIPSTILHIRSNNPCLRLQDSDSSTGTNTSQIQFYNSNNSIEGFVGYDSTNSLMVSNSNSSGSINFRTGGSTNDKLIINSTGNIGIGNTTSIWSTLQIYKSSADTYPALALGNGSLTTLSPQLRFMMLTTSYSHYIATQHHGSLSQSNLMSFYIGQNVSSGNTLGSYNINVLTLTGTGNVGIGTTICDASLHIYQNSPMIKLHDNNHIQGTTLSLLQYYNSGNTLEGYIGFSNNANLIVSNSNISGSIKLQTNSIDRIIIDNTGITTINSNLYIQTGRIGIGTTNPNVSFHVNSNDAIQIPTGPSTDRPIIGNIGMLRYNTTTLQYEGFTNNNWAGMGGVIDVNQDTKITAETVPGTNNDQLQMYTKGSQAMIIDSNQYVGIGTTIPSTILHIRSNNPYLRLQDSDSSTGTNHSQIQFYNSNNSIEGFIGYNSTSSLMVSNSNTSGSIKFQTGGSTIDKLVIDSTGNIGIGITNPQYKFYVNGSSYLYGDMILGTSVSTIQVPTGSGIHFGNGITDSATQKIRIFQSGASAYIDWTGDNLLRLRVGPTVIQKFVFDGGNGYLGINMSGTPTYNLDVTGTGRFTGIVTLNNNLIVSGNTNITGGVALSNSLNVSGTTNLNNNLIVSGNTNITGGVALSNSLNVSGTTNLNNNLIVSGVSSFSNDVSIISNKTLTVNGNTNLYNTLSLNPTNGTGNGTGISFLSSADTKYAIYRASAGATNSFSKNTAISYGEVSDGIRNRYWGSFSSMGFIWEATDSSSVTDTGLMALSAYTGNLMLKGKITANSLDSSTGTNTFLGNLSVTGVTTLNGIVSISNNVSLLNSKSLTVGTGDTILGGILNVGGISTFNSNVNISGINTLITGTGAVTHGGILNVSSVTTINSNLYIQTGRIGIGTTNPKTSMHVNSNDALILPIGSSTERPPIGSNGMVRYNTTTLQYEGFTNNNWTGLGGVVDVNQDTRITAETAPGTNNDQLQMYTKGLQAVVIDSNQYVGIGTTIPSTILHIRSNNPCLRLQDSDSSTGTNTSQIQFYNSNNSIEGFVGYDSTNSLMVSNSNNSGSIKFRTGGSINDKLVIDSTGNIGIGSTTNITANLQIYKTTADISCSTLALGGGTTTGILYPQIRFMTVNSSQNYSHYIATLHSTVSNSNLISFYVGQGSASGQTLGSENINVMTLTGAGNVGIGTTICDASLHIYQNSPMIKLHDNNHIKGTTLSLLQYYNSGNTLEGYIGFSNNSNLIISNSNTSGTINLQTNSIDRITINSNGYVGIGSTVPVSTLDVDGDIISNGITLSGITFTDDNNLISNFTENLNSLGDLYYIYGNVGIGTTNPKYNLDINGSTNINSNLFVSSNVGIGTTNPKYNLDINGSTNINSNLFVSSNVGIGTTNPKYNLDINGSTNINSNLYVSSNVGIGIINPTGKLHVYNSNSTQETLILTNGADYNNLSQPQIRFGYNGTTNYGHFIGTRHSSTTSNYNAIDFYCGNITQSNFINSGSTQVMTLTGSGNVGIGTTNPLYNLDIKGKLNTTTIEDYEYPPSALTNYTTTLSDGIYTVSTSGEWGGGISYTAFNKSFTDVGWHTNATTAAYDASGNHIATTTTTNIDGSGTYKGEWLQLQLPDSIKLSKYKIFCRYNTANYFPRAWKLLGSSNNSTWTTLDFKDEILYTNSISYYTTFNITNNNYYNYYRIVINKSNSGSYSAMAELVLYGRKKTDILNYNYNQNITTLENNIGIGTTNPVGRLQINNMNITDDTLILTNGGLSTDFTRPQIRFGYNGSTNYGHFIGTRHDANATGSTGNGNSIDFYCANSNYNCGTSQGGCLNNTITNGSRLVMTICGSGNVGIGNTNPSYQLQLTTDSAAKPGAGGLWTIASDIRLKTNISVADYNRCYEVMSNLDLKKYTWRDDIPELNSNCIRDRTSLGWIADDVLLHYPKAVNSNNIMYGLSNVLDLNAGQIYACMYGTIKYLMMENTELKSKIDYLYNYLNINV
jgi:hypothetical protein